MADEARGIGAALLHEARTALPPTLFFLAAFNALALTIGLVGDGGSVSAATHFKVTIGALIAGKAVLIADRLPFFNRYPHKPLIWNVVWKAALYVAVAAALRLVERLISEGWPPESFDWPRFWAILLWLAILFITYSAFREAVGVIGRDRALAIFLAPPDRRDGRR